MFLSPSPPSQKLNLLISNTQVTFYGGLFDIIEHFMLHTKLNSSAAQSIQQEQPVEETSKPRVDVEKLVGALTPQLFVIQVENTEIKSLDKQNSFHYHLLLHHVEIKGKIDASDVCRAKITNLRIYTPAQEVLHLRDLSMSVKSSENSSIAFDIKLDTLSLVYSHDDIYGWFVKIFLKGMKSNRKEMIVRAFKAMNRMMVELYYSEFTQKLFEKIVPNFSASLHNVKLVSQLDDQVSSLNVSSLRCLLSQSSEKRRHFYEDYTMNLILKDRQWHFEVITDAPLCWYMGPKFDYLNLDAKKTYIRGSALLIESFTLRLGSQDDVLNLDLHVNTLRAEYSQKLTQFALQSIKCCKEYVDLFSQLSTAHAEKEATGERKTISIETILEMVTIDAKVSNVSCFLINRHEVCVIANLAQISSIDSFNYELDTFEVSTVDFAKYNSVHDMAEFSTIYVSTKLLRVNLFATNDQPQIGVDFCEKLECSWNAYFLRHLLSIARDFHRFKKGAEDALGLVRENTFALPRSLPVGLDIKKLRNIRIKHADVNVDKLILLINELSGENLFFYHYFH